MNLWGRYVYDENHVSEPEDVEPEDEDLFQIQEYILKFTEAWFTYVKPTNNWKKSNCVWDCSSSMSKSSGPEARFSSNLCYF